MAARPLYIRVSLIRLILKQRLAELADSERKLQELEALPSLVEEYLRELPHLLDLKPLLREYETSAPEAKHYDPLGALYTITPERIRFLPEGELAEKRRAVEEKRARRFRELYSMLDLKVVCHKDRSLEVSWGAHCHEWLGCGPTQVGTTPSLTFRAVIGVGGDVEVSLR